MNIWSRLTAPGKRRGRIPAASRRSPSFAGLVVLLALAAGLGEARASVIYNVSFNDPGGQYAGYYSELRTDIQAAGSDWARYLAGSGTINISVQFANIPTLSSYSMTSAYVGKNGSIAVYEQGALAKLQSNGSGGGIDATINVGTAYLTNELWFDPNPYARTAPVPTNKTDAESAFIHEFGHIFAFSGWRNPYTGALSGNYESTFDSLITQKNGYLYFTGKHAESVYGGPVPLTYGNYEHVGNQAPGPGSNLLSDLMNGVLFYRGTRYDISALDLAILDDTGVELTSYGIADLGANAAALPGSVPEPSAAIMLLGPLVALFVQRRSQGRGQRALLDMSYDNRQTQVGDVVDPGHQLCVVADALAERDMDEFTRARLRKQARPRHEETMELRRLIKEFDDFADTLLPAENVTDDDYDDITEVMIRAADKQEGEV
jgi:hypothetical protein